MATTFVTGSDQANLAANISSAITAGKRDLTIYSVTPATIGSNIDNLIPNLSLLQALRFSDVNDLPTYAFSQANFSGLQELTGNFSSFSGQDLFTSANMNALKNLSLPQLTTISGQGIFYQVNMNALTAINLPNLTSWTGGVLGLTFASASMNALTSINWPATLPSLPSQAFDAVSVPKLFGICLGKVTTFNNITFQNITQGPSDMRALSGKTQTDLVYASDFYGYACPPLIFNIPVGSSDNVFNNYTYKNYAGTPATGLTITAVNEIPTPVTIGNINFQQNGTITVKSDVPNTTFSMRFSATGPSPLIGARSVKVKPCFFTVSDVKTTTSIGTIDRKTGLAVTPPYIRVKGFHTWNQSGQRKVAATFKQQTLFNNLSSDGSFSLDFITSDFSSDTILLVLSTNNGSCPTTFTSNYVKPSSFLNTTTLKINLIGSLFDFQLTLPSDFDSQASDKNSMFSDLCAFAQTQPLNRISASFETLENSDMFASDAVITTGIHDVFVSCSDQCLNISETSDLFSFKICSFTSDSKVNYSDTNPANTVSDKPAAIPSITTEITASSTLAVVEIASSTPCTNTLSDIHFSASSSDHFQITGYQLDPQTGTRTLSASYMNTTQTQSFNVDGFFFFDFTNTPISDGALVNIIAQGNNCKAITTTITPNFSTSDCIKILSDIQFSAFSSNDFKITGYQFYNKPVTRTVSASYINASDQTQSFNSDGFFQFIFTNTTIITGEPVTITTKGSDCALTASAVASQNQTITQGILNAGFTGSLLDFNFALPPDLAITLSSTSDVHTVFSDMRAYAQMQECQSFLAGIVINSFSDLFCSDAIITQRPEVIVVSCSDNVLHLDDDDDHFTFSITDFMSDIVLIRYSDTSCQVSDSMSLIGGSFTLQTSDTHFIWVTPCNSDVPNTFTNVFNHPLLAIDAEGNVVDIGFIDCSVPCHNPTSDLLYVSRLKASTLKLGQYLSDHYSDYANLISDQCRVKYLGPITADIVTADFDACRLVYQSFSIPFSDIDVCD